MKIRHKIVYLLILCFILSVKIYAQTVSVTSPVGGEVWKPGTSHNITWTNTGSITNVKISYSTDAGANWTVITNSTANAPHTYSWTVPNKPSKNCRIRVQNASGAGVGTSAANFTIQGIDIISPNGFEEMARGSHFTIAWNSANISNAKIEFSSDGGATYSTVAGGASVAAGNLSPYDYNTFDWTVPNVLSSNCRIRISDVSDAANYAASLDPFIIKGIDVVLPNGGETLVKGTTYTITWNTAGVAASIIEYSTNGGSTYTTVTGADSVATADGTNNFLWTVPNIPSTHCLIRITDYFDPSYTDVSNAEFTIKGILVTSPNGGETFVRGASHSINWTSESVTNVKIEYSTDGGTNYTTVAGGSSVPSSGASTFSWTVPNTPSVNCLIRISDASNASLNDVSDAVFTIKGLIITSPNGSNVVAVGSSQTLAWTSAGIANVKLEYSTDGGTSYTTVSGGSSVPSSGATTFSWTVPASPSLNCLFRVSDASNASFNDVSDAVFTISGIVVVAPNGGEQIEVGSTYSISWNSAGIANAKLEYSTNNGSSYTTVAGGSSVASSGLTNFSWTVPNSPSATCLIRVSDAANASNYDVSNAVFTIKVSTPPTLVSPPDAITGIPLQPRLDWNPVAGSTGYTVTISKNITFTDPATFTINASTNTFVVLTEARMLEPNTVYYWKVDNSGAASSTRWFRTAAAVAVSLVDPINNKLVYNLSPVLTWYSNPSGAAGAIKFKIQLVQQNAMPADSTQWASGTYWYVNQYDKMQATGLIGGKTYWWRVIAMKDYNNQGNYRIYGYSSPTSFITVGGNTVICNPTYPANGITVLTSPFQAFWYVDNLQIGLKYQIRYTTAGTGSTTGGELDAGTNYPSDINMPAATTTNLFMEFPSIPNSVHAYWQVRVYDGSTSSFGPWSAVKDFIMSGPGTLFKPINAYPVDGITVYTTSPQLTWYLGQAYSGITFHVYYREIGAGAFTGPITPSPAYVTTHTLSGLKPGSSYEWYAASYNGVTESVPSDIDTFTVAGGPTTYAVAYNPVNDITVYSNSPRVTWYLEGYYLGVAGYNIEYRLHGAGSWTHAGPVPTVSGPFANYYDLPSLNWGNEYDWRVGVYDGVTTNWNAAGEGTFIVTGGSLNPPILTSPVSGSVVYSSSPILTWYVNGTLSGIVSFILEYSPSPNFANPLLTVSELLNPATLNKNLSGLTPGSTYWWRVRAWYGGSVYADSPVNSFSIDLGSPSVAQPIIGSPNQVTVTTSSPLLSWYNTVKTDTRQKYELEYSTSESLAGSSVISNISVTKLALTNLRDGEYYWRVRGKSGTGEISYYSGVGKFTVKSGAVSVEKKSEMPTGYELKQNYPNPFNPTTTIKFSMTEASFVSLKVFDLLGREVKTLLSTELSAGSYSINWNGDNEAGQKVASGNYIYRISAGKFSQARKMTLLK